MLRIAERASNLTSEATTQRLLENAYDQRTRKAWFEWKVDITDKIYDQSGRFFTNFSVIGYHYMKLLSNEEQKIGNYYYDQDDIGPYYDPDQPLELFHNEPSLAISTLSDELHYAQDEGQSNHEAMISNPPTPMSRHAVNNWEMITASQSASDWSNTTYCGAENQIPDLESSYALHSQVLLPGPESSRSFLIESDTSTRVEGENLLWP